ncbi:MAG: tyrosine-type recombinase/integrase [Burkholderiales bacterium]|nr:tyrosine-type recombinase/integrase [Burkholderiales bacterium]
MARPAAHHRKLNAAHFAFMRGLVQGLPLREMWERYLQGEGSSSDLRVVRSTIAWIRDAFAAAARREARFGTARLVLIDAEQLPEDLQAMPSLEEFAESRGLEDFSQAEQIEAFETEFGKASQHRSRRSRIVQKQLEALRWLEGLVSQPPGPGDSVCAWLNPTIARRLEGAGIFTLAQLVERVNGLGQGWARSIAGVGKAKGDRVVAWLLANEDAIGMPIGRHVQRRRTDLLRQELARVVAPATDIRPLEKLVVPAELDGTQGLFRRPQAHCLIDASNDYAALLTWLQSKASLTPEQRAACKARRRGRDTGVDGVAEWLGFLSHTQRAYRKEAERFLLWAVVERRKPLSSMATEDCIAYRDFIADPQPRARWCAPRNRERWSPLWRPFEKPLNATSRRFTVTVLKNLYAFWADKNYVMGNPWTGVTVPRSSEPRINTGRSLTMAQWRFALGQAKQLPKTSTGARLRFALSLLYATGLRLSEAVASKVDALEWVEYPPDEEDQDHVKGWLLNVLGKGGRLRQVPVPLEVISELAAYLTSRGLHSDPEDPSNAGVFLLGKATDIADLAPSLQPAGGVDVKAGIVANTLYDQLKRFFEDCGSVLGADGDSKGAAQFAKASTHWLRHTHASHSIARGTRVEIEQQILGHASLATTTVYVTTEGKRRMKAIASFWRR